jgi:hypothetical protein
MFACELALELRMSLRELGESMSAHELCVIWPAFFETRRRAQEREAEKQRGRM